MRKITEALYVQYIIYTTTDGVIGVAHIVYFWSDLDAKMTVEF